MALSSPERGLAGPGRWARLGAGCDLGFVAPNRGFSPIAIGRRPCGPEDMFGGGVCGELCGCRRGSCRKVRALASIACPEERCCTLGSHRTCSVRLRTALTGRSCRGRPDPAFHARLMDLALQAVNTHASKGAMHLTQHGTVQLNIMALQAPEALFPTSLLPWYRGSPRFFLLIRSSVIEFGETPKVVRAFYAPPESP